MQPRAGLPESEDLLDIVVEAATRRTSIVAPSEASVHISSCGGAVSRKMIKMQSITSNIVHE